MPKSRGSSAAEFVSVRVVSPVEQLRLLDPLRPQLETIEFVFEDGETDGHPLVAALAGLRFETGSQRGPRHGYDRWRPGSISLRYVYHRSILRAVADLGGLFQIESDRRNGDRVLLSGLGNVDLVLYGAGAALLLYTVTHEGLVFMRADLVPPDAVID